MAASLPTSLTLMMAAALVLYLGTRLLWSAVGCVGLWRGAIMALPLIALAAYQAPAGPGTAVAVLVSAAVLAVTLGLGVSTIDLPTPEADGSPTLRTLLPLAAATCLAGFHGDLAWWHALALLAVGGLTLWSADGERRTHRAEGRPRLLPFAVVLLLVGLVVLAVALDAFSHAAGSSVRTPVVLLTVPAVLLALLGLLTAEAREHLPETPHETVVGLAVACLGFGLPLVIGVSLLTPQAMKLKPVAKVFSTEWIRFLATQPAVTATTTASTAATRPAAWPTPTMPISTWRVDSVLLVVVAMLLLPVGFGRFKIGRAEGAWLILIYLAYAAVATRVGATNG